MGLFFEIGVLVALVLIALELYAIRAELSRLPNFVRRAEEKKDSPTINVNVGTLPAAAAQPQAEAGAPAPVPAESAPSSASEAAVAEPEPLEPEPPRAPEPVYHPTPVSATPSGLLAVKCPKCQAENSSYRSECFNCGAALH